jgi:hypothetical protein
LRVDVASTAVTRGRVLVLGCRVTESPDAVLHGRQLRDENSIHLNISREKYLVFYVILGRSYSRGNGRPHRKDSQCTALPRIREHAWDRGGVLNN